MDTVQYFGYGSLVNRETRPADEAFEPVTVSGWQRAWSHQHVNERAATVPGWSISDHNPLGYTVLSVEPCSDEKIDGVQVRMVAADLPALDARESGYSRHSVSSTMSTDPVAIYVSKTERTKRACNDYPLLQSYVDCVLAGYLAVFGWDGVRRFLSTTKGWAAPVLPDRDAPLYPRAVKLDAKLVAEFDELVVEAGREERSIEL